MMTKEQYQATVAQPWKEEIRREQTVSLWNVRIKLTTLTPPLARREVS